MNDLESRIAKIAEIIHKASSNLCALCYPDYKPRPVKSCSHCNGIAKQILALFPNFMIEIDCPWPESVWTMTDKQYVEAIPDEKLRTAISGFLMRKGWEIAKEDIIKQAKSSAL